MKPLAVIKQDFLIHGFDKIYTKFTPISYCKVPESHLAVIIIITHHSLRAPMT